MDREEQKLQTQPNLLIVFLLLIVLSKKDTKKLSLQEVDLVDLDKKAKLLNRIKGYMEPNEQHVIHSAETLLQVIRNVKLLVEPPELRSAGVRYSSLSVEDRKRNMLMDLSEFLEDEKKMVVHKAVDFDTKVRTLEKKLKELHSISQDGNHIANMNRYIEVFEPLLVNEAKEKLYEFKKLASVINLVGTLKSKDQINEMDIVELIQPFVNKEQGDSLMRMVQIFKVISSMSSEDSTPLNNNEQAQAKLKEDKESKDIEEVKENKQN